MKTLEKEKFNELLEKGQYKALWQELMGLKPAYLAELLSSAPADGSVIAFQQFLKLTSP